MKRIVFCSLIVLVFVFTSCNTYDFVLPVGLWKSDDPIISFDVVEDENIYDYYGIYVKDGKEFEIFAVFSQFNNRFSIFDVCAIDENTNSINTEYEYLYGEFVIKDDKMTYTLLPHWQEMTGIKEIVFTRVDDIDTAGEK